MQLGIKIGPNNWKENLEESKAGLTEVWFRPDSPENYEEMFGYLKSRQIKTGLHFWGICKDNIYPSLLTSRQNIRQESIELMKKAVDFASKNGFYYVNAHPESRILFKLILPEGKVMLLNGLEDENIGYKNLLESVKILTDYARKKKVLFILETVPRMVPKIWWGEKNREPVDTKTVPSDWYLKLGKEGIAVNLDLGHVLTECKSADPKEPVQFLKEKTVFLAPYLKLIHLSANIPPFNGTDSHNGFEKKDYESGAIPDLESLKEILKLVKSNKDLMLIPEPEKNHVENYFILKELISSL